MAKNRNTYQILKSCFVTGGTSTLATVSNTYELFKAVYDTSAGALRISLSGGTGVSTLEGLTDTLITSPVGGQILAWNGSVWVNYDPSGDWVSASTSLFDGAFGSLTGVPTTIAGYGITDAYTSTETDGNFLSANTSYYTEAEADANFLSGNTSIMGTGATGLVENMSMQIEFTTGVSYYLVSKSAYDFDVNSINFACDIGTTTISLKYDSAFPQGSATNIFSSVTGGTSLEEYTTDSSNTVAAGKNLMLRVDSITAEATTLYATIKTTRV